MLTFDKQGTYKDENMPELDITSAIIRVSPDIELYQSEDVLEEIEECVIFVDASPMPKLYFSFDESDSWHELESGTKITDAELIEQLNESMIINLRYVTDRNEDNLFSIADLAVISTYVTLIGPEVETGEEEQWEKYFLWK